MKKRKLLILSLASVFVLGACSSESEKLRENYLEQADIALASGELLKGVQLLDSANSIAAFNEEEAAYKTKYQDNLMKVTNTALNSANSYKEEGDYEAAKEQYDIVNEVLTTINFPFEASFSDEVKKSIKENESLLKEYNNYNDFYNILKDNLIKSDELNVKYFDILDRKRNNLTDDATFNTEIRSLQDSIKKISKELNEVETPKFSRTYTQDYYNYYTRLVDLNDWVLESTYSITDVSVIPSTIETVKEQKKTILDIEKNYVEFGKTNGFSIEE